MKLGIFRRCGSKGGGHALWSARESARCDSTRAFGKSERAFTDPARVRSSGGGRCDAGGGSPAWERTDGRGRVKAATPCGLQLHM